MKFSIFQNKVARRLTLLFVLSALLPIAMLSFITFSKFYDYFVEQNRQQLHLATKNVGMGIIDKLVHLQKELKHIAHEVRQDKDYLESTRLNPDKYLFRDFSSLSIKFNNNRRNDSIQRPIIDGGLTSNDLIHLQIGKTILRTSKTADGEIKIFIILALNQNNINDGLLIGEVSNEHFWNISNILQPASDVCVFNALFDVLHCSNPDVDIETLKQNLLMNKSASPYFEWRQSNNTYSSYKWPIFLLGAFKSPEWFVVMSKSKSDIYSTMSFYKTVYPAVILASALLIALLSSTQIRKYLIPLEMLKAGTREIAKGNFSTQLNLKSNDEFEELASAYNDMTRKLDRQFKSLSTMSEVDRSILTSLDPDYIIETVLKAIQELIPQSDVNILSIEQHQPVIHAYSFRTTAFFKHKIEIDDNDEKLMKQHASYLIINPGEHVPDFLAETGGDTSFTHALFPIFLKDDLNAIVVIRHPREYEYQDTDYGQIRELIDRIAVALTNASWEGKLYHQSNYDNLTQLPNRTLLKDRLDQAIKRARRDRTQVAVLFLDIDRFKSINDSMGYKAGDNLIKLVANRLYNISDIFDSFGRYGSDEFLFILSDVSYKANAITKISTLAESILKEIKKPFIVNNHEIRITASIGISMNPSDAVKVDELLNYAEIAMHHAKSQGKGSFHFYAKEINAQSFAQLVLENDLRRALEKDELEIFYQPQFDIRSFELVGAEALIRWNHPRLGMLYPGQFLAMANESGLILHIGEWVLINACRQIKDCQDKGLRPAKIAINLSSHQFRDEGLVGFINQVIKDNGIKTDYIELEMTEDTIMSDIDKATSILHKLKSLGFHLAVDDFGTGYSTLNYLAKFPVNCLKIDQSFVQDMIKDANVKSIVSAIVALGHSLNLKVIAEGIETQKQLEMLKHLQCDVVQGYFLSEPLSFDEFKKLLHKHRSTSYKHAN